MIFPDTPPFEDGDGDHGVDVRMHPRASPSVGSTIRLVPSTTGGHVFREEDRLENASPASRFSFHYAVSIASAVDDGDGDVWEDDYAPPQAQGQVQVDACEDRLDMVETTKHGAPDSRQHSTWVRVQGVKNAAARYRCTVDGLQMRLMQSLEHRVLERHAACDMALGFAAERKIHEENLEKAFGIIDTLEQLLNLAEKKVNDIAHPTTGPDSRARDVRHKRSVSV